MSQMLKEVEETDEFETNQTVLAAYLVYEGHELARTLWENNMCTFFFENTEQLQASFGIFLQGKARVEPVGFNNAFGQVLGRVKEERRQRQSRQR